MSPNDLPRSSNEAGIDLTGLREEYPRPFTGTLRWTVLAAQVAALITAVPQLLSGSWPARAVAVVLVACVVLGVLMQFWRPPATLVSAEGLRVRKVLVAGPLVPWADLARFDVQGRYEAQSTAHTIDGRQIPLIGLTHDAAEHLAREIGRPERH